MTETAKWKDRFRAGMYASAELREKKIHRDLLGYLLYRANAKNRFCWCSQAELARVQGCSIRNIKDLLDYLAKIGAIYPVRIADMPKGEQAMIKALTPLKVVRNANAYFICEEWSREVASETEITDVDFGKPTIAPDHQAKGREKANSKRRRYAPVDLQHRSVFERNPSHDDWLILNAMGVQTGSPTSPLKRVQTGSPTTDMYTELNPDAFSASVTGHTAADRPVPSSEANQISTSISSMSDQSSETVPHGYGGGVAGASVPRATPLARPEGTEYDAAHARANDRRAS